MIVLLFALALIICYFVDGNEAYEQIAVVVLLVVGLVLYAISRKADRGFERFPFNDGGFGD